MSIAPAGADRSIVGLHKEDGAVCDLEHLHVKCTDSDIRGSSLAPASSRMGLDRIRGPSGKVDANAAEVAVDVALGIANGEPGVVLRVVQDPRNDQRWIDATEVGTENPSNLGFPVRRRETMCACKRARHAPPPLAQPLNLDVRLATRGSAAGLHPVRGTPSLLAPHEVLHLVRGWDGHGALDVAEDRVDVRCLDRVRDRDAHPMRGEVEPL